MSAKTSWRPPVAICSVCERERPCHYASTSAPVCQSCRRGRLARREPCAGCGQTKRVVARTPRGPECSACRTRRLKATLDCVRCDNCGCPSVTDPRICERCAGEPVRQVCRGCGAEEQDYGDGRCARCVLAERLQALADAADPRAVERLAPYLAALRDGDRPWSVLNWMTVSAGYGALVELARGKLELSHDGLDTVQRARAPPTCAPRWSARASCPSATSRPPRSTPSFAPRWPASQWCAAPAAAASGAGRWSSLSTLRRYHPSARLSERVSFVARTSSGYAVYALGH